MEELYRVLREIAAGRLDPSALQLHSLGNKLSSLSEADVSALASRLTPNEFTALGSSKIGGYTNAIRDSAVLGGNPFEQRSEVSRLLRELDASTGYTPEKAPLITETLPDGTAFPANPEEYIGKFDKGILTDDRRAEYAAVKAQVDANRDLNARNAQAAWSEMLGQVPEAPVQTIQNVAPVIPSTVPETVATPNPKRSPRTAVKSSWHSPIKARDSGVPIVETPATADALIDELTESVTTPIVEDEPSTSQILQDLQRDRESLNALNSSNPGGASLPIVETATSTPSAVQTPTTVDALVNELTESAAVPVARTMPDSLQLPPTSAASVANSFQLPHVGRDIPVSMPTDPSESLLKALAGTRGDVSGETPAMNAFKKKRGRDPYTSTMRGIANPDPVSGGRAPLRMERTLSSVPKTYPDSITDILGEDTPVNGLTRVTSPQTVTFGKGKGRHDLLIHTPDAIGSRDDLRSFFRRFGIGGSKGSGDPLKAAATGSAPKTGGLFAPGFGAKVQEGLGKLSDPQLDWTKGTGLKAYGHNIGGLASTAQSLYGAYQIADALSENTKAKNTTEDITSDILTAAAGNPMAAYDLTADQKRLLGELKRGSYDDSSDMGSLDWGAGLSGALKGGVAGFLGGGTTGAVVGALSSGVPAAMRGMASEQERKNAELEALYAALSESDARYRDARRQKAMRMYY